MLLNGAKRIFIIAPVPRKYTKTIKKMEDGEEVEELITCDYTAFRYVYVYDVSQTEGEPLPLSTSIVTGDDMAYFYEKLKNISKIPVIEETLKSSVQGYYNKKGNIIVIDKTMPENNKAATLLHEMAHSLYDDFDYKTDRDLSEVFVESIAYIVADHFGLDTSLCSFNYIIKWANGEPKKVIELGTKIQNCANEFIKQIEEYNMQELKSVA